MKKFAAVFAIVTSLVVGLLPLSLVHASGSVMSLSPSSQTVTNGGTFNVQVRANVSHNDAGDDDGITVILAFPQSRLQVVSLSSAGSSFSPGAQQSFNNGNGRVNIFQNWNDTEPQGDLLITTITFRAVATGNATVSYAYAEVGNNDTPATSGETYAVVAPPPSPTLPSPPPASPPPSSPSSPSSPASPKPPSVSSPSGAPSSSPVLLPGSSSTPTNPSTTPSGDSDSTDLDSDPFASLSALPVSLKVVDDKKRPVSKAKIVIGNKTYRTNAHGIANLSLIPKTYSATISNSKLTKTTSFTVKPVSIEVNSSPKTQTFIFTLSPAEPFGAWLLIGGVGLAGLLVAGVFVLIARRRRRSQPSLPSKKSPSTAPPVVEGAFFSAPAPILAPKPIPAKPMTSFTAQLDPVPTAQPPTPPPAAQAPPKPFIDPTPPPKLTVEPLSSPPPAPVRPETIPAPTPAAPAPLPEAPPAAPNPEPLLTEDPEPTQPQPKPPRKQYNSVYLDEEEPKDMFELAEEQFHYHDRSK